MAIKITIGKTKQKKLTLGSKSNVSISSSLPPRIVEGGISRLHDFVLPYSYCGKAPKGTATSGIWTIVRIQIAPNGSTSIATATGAWTNRESLIYS